MRLKTIFALLFLFAISTFSYSQETVEEIKEKGEKLFADEKYLEATPYYLRLLAIEPRDHNTNYRYATCLLYNASKGQDVFKYLNYAISNENVEVEAYFFLAKAYHLNYQFNDAIKYYKIYQQKAGEKAKVSLDVKRQIEMCENGKRLITTITEMKVIDKKEIEIDKFFRIYDLSDIGGNLLVTAEFQTKIDEKKAHIPLIHFPATPTVIYYSSYGETGKTGKDIYVRRRLPTGGWGIPQALQGGVNSNFDEDYPYMHPDGQYLYFSSKGHNSMGGFDVYRCKYDAETDMFGLAENMDYAVSSPDDDLFYVVDSLNKNAYFGSGRQSEEGKLHVFKVRVDRVPLNMSVIKGEFSSTINPAMKKVLIDVKDYASGEFIGNFNSNEKGVYLITFPKGGKYEFTIKVGDSPQEYKYIASIPFLKEFKPLKQKIIHAMDGERENVKVIDLFNEEVEDPQAVFAQVLKLKAVLAPNISQAELDALDKEAKSKEVLNELGIGNLSLVEVGYLLEEEVQDAKKAQNGTKDIENKINTQVVANSVEIKRLDDLIKHKLEKANSADSDKKKYKFLKEADRALKAQEDLKLANVINLKYADSLSKLDNIGSDAKTAEITKYSQHFNELIKENKQIEAYAYLYENKEALKKIIDEKSLDPLQEMVEKGLALDEEIGRLQPKDDQFARDIKKIEQDIATLEQSKVTAKKKDLPDIEAAIKAKNSEKTMVADERKFYGAGLNEKIAERSALRKQIDILEGIYTIKSDKVITKEELNNAVSSTNATNSTQVRSEIGQEIAELIKKSPDVKDVDYADLESELGSVVAKSRSQSDQIKADTKLTPAEKANKLKALDRELLISINDEILATQKSLKQNPTDPQLKSKLDALQAAKSIVATSLDIPEGEEDATLSASNTQQENPVVSNNEKTPTSTNSPLTSQEKETLIEAITPTYNEKVAQINNNASLSESEKLNQLQQADKELLSTLENEISKTQSASTSNPSDQNLSKKLDNLKTIQSDIESAITSRETEIASSVNTALDTKGKENLIESFNPSYNEKIAQINNNGTLSESEKLILLQEADKGLLSSIESEISKVESAHVNSPSDQNLKKKIEDLKSIQSELESTITSREASITTSVNTLLDSKGKEKIIESVTPSYNETVAQINNNGSFSNSEKLSQLQAVDKELIKSIEKEIESLETASKKNPGDATLTKKLADFKTVQSELESAVASRESAISSSSGSSVLDSNAKEKLIESITPSYNEKVAQINSNGSISSSEKLAQLQQADKELLKTIENEISKTEAASKKNPGDVSLTKKLSDLKTLETELESTIASRESTIASNVNTSSSLIAKDKEGLIEAINPEYNEKVAQINSNTSISESDKLVQLQQIDKDLIATLNKEISKVEDASKKNPSDLSLSKKVEDLKTIKSELESTVTTRESVIASTGQPLSQKAKTDLIDALNPMYNVKVAEIKKNNSLSDIEKLTQLQQADKDLIASMSKEILALENNVKNNPDPQLIKELADFKSVKFELESTVVERESAIASTTSKSPTISGQAKENLIESVVPSYNEKVAQINSNGSLSSSEKLKQLQQLDKELLTSVNKEISSTETVSKANPSDQILSKKSTDLKSVKSELESAIASRETTLASSGNSTFGSEEKSNLIESVSPAYNEKVAQINSNGAFSESDKLNKLQEADKELVVVIENEKLSAEAAFKKNPSDKKLADKMTDLVVLKSELQSDITSRESAIAATNSKSPELTDQAKINVIESVNPAYNEKVEKISTNGSLSEFEKLTQLQQADNELLTSINKEISKVETALTKKPSDASLIKQASDLKQIKSELESDISSRDKEIASLHKPIDPELKAELIKSVDSKYNKKIQEIENNSELSVTEKLNQLQEADYALIEKIDKEIVSVEADLTKKPSDEILKKQLGDLKSVKSEVEASISARETVIASSGNTLDQNAKAELVESVSASYNEKVIEIKSNEYLLDSEKLNQLQQIDKNLLVKIENEITSLESKLAKNPSNAQAKRKLDGLKVVKSDLETTIQAREKSLSPEGIGNALTAKSDLIETFDAGYTEKVKEINSDALNTELDKMAQLQALDKELSIKLDKEIAKATSAAKSKKKDETLKKAKDDLIELKSIADKVISDRAQAMTNLLAGSVTTQQKNDLITEVKSDHNSKIDGITNSNSDQSLKLQELIKEEKILLAKLEAEEKTTQASLKSMQANSKKVPVDEATKTKAIVIAASKNDSETKIAVLTEQAVILKASTIDQKVLVTKVDPTFEEDVKKLTESTSSTKPTDLALREEQFQEKIETQIADNKAKIASNYNLDLAAENKILAEKLKESETREVSFKAGQTTTDVTSVKTTVKSTTQSPEKIQELRTEILADSAEEVGKNYTTVEDLKKQEDVLSTYSEALKIRLEKVNKELEITSSDSVLLEQKAILQSESSTVEAKLRKTANMIEELEQSSESALMSPELKNLIDQESDIKTKLENADLTKKERVALEKELLQVQTEKSNVENTLITDNIVVRKTENQQQTVELKKLASTSEIAKVSVELANSQNTRLSEEADALIAKSDKTKNPIEKNELLNQAIEKQVKADEIVQTALEENATRAAINNKVSTLDSKEELEQKKRNYTAEIGELRQQIEQLDTEIAAVKPKKAVDMIAKRDVLVSEKEMTEKELQDVENQISEIIETPTTISESALEQAVSFNEEKRLIASKEYLEYSINANKALRIEKQIAESEVILTEKRQIAKETIAMSLDKSSKISQAEVAESVQNVKIVEDEIVALTTELEEKQKTAASLLANNEQDAMRMQNLLKRGVEPEFNETLAQLEKEREPAVGLKVVSAETPVNSYSASNPIPLDVKNPAGLVYRIQVGAFSKPIAQDMYKSFNPISGEKLSSGVTRYMAGYFNNSKTVDEAHTQVKSLGYSDAFIVAYCDDERIPLAEARRLEASGQCISTESREFVIATSAKPAATSINVSDLTYNEAPGAAKATPAESRLGLFYTVQVGVYNKPATSKQLKNIDPLITKRLPNGQIRYSTGMFNSVESAKPKKGEAIEKGIRDAFVAAYYQGERITLSQASKLLKQNGDGILEKLDKELVSSITPSETEKIETSSETIAKTEVEKVSAYNKAPGAEPATAVETRLGLFFTVQIGVYSKPATKKQLKYVTPLITKKLPNGQLRYSTGMFRSIEEAEPKRLETLAKGVKHAYITAYYKGERITIAEAKELLNVNGEGILEKIEK